MKKEISIIIDNDPSKNYEKEKWIYILFTPIMFLLTFWVVIKKLILGPNLKTNSFWVDGISPISREIKEGAQGWRAIDILYNYKFGKEKGIVGKISDFWLKTLNAQAIRNRFKIVKQCLRGEIERIRQTTTEIRILSIASGSAQAVIEVMEEFKKNGVIINAILLDLDPSALSHSRILAQKAGVIEQIELINKNAKETEEIMKNFKPQIVEVVGFLEYRPKEGAIRLIERIYRLLNANEVFLTSTVTPNSETLFLHYVVNWPMIHRTLKQFIEILTRGGFKTKDIKIIYDPLKIQKIAICRKTT
jgi:hypothetical protein